MAEPAAIDATALEIPLDMVTGDCKAVGQPGPDPTALRSNTVAAPFSDTTCGRPASSTPPSKGPNKL